VFQTANASSQMLDLKNKIIPSGPQKLAEPEKELRFTRARQAGIFYAAAVVCFTASMAVFILSTQDWGIEAPLLHGWLWLCVPGLLLSFLALRMGIRCTRHAYLIVTPLGVEIFPFFKAEKNLQIIYWSEVADAEVSPDLSRMTLHFNREKKSGVVVSLNPIPRERRALLEKVVSGMAQKIAKQSDAED